MTITEEDEIIAKAEAIKQRAFDAATTRWRNTPDDQKKRPWPHCGNITCNRTLVCQSPCQGFDF
jgi:hypothetical protein